MKIVVSVSQLHSLQELAAASIFAQGPCFWSRGGTLGVFKVLRTQRPNVPLYLWGGPEQGERAPDTPSMTRDVFSRQVCSDVCEL